MTILARLSVRTILVAVFTTLALALCGAWLFQIHVAWQARSLAQGLATLASVDEGVFKETGSAAGDVLAVAKQVSAQSDSLRGQVDEFLTKIRAA